MSQKHLKHIEYFKYLCCVITNDARCTRGITSRIAMAKASFNEKKTFHQQIEVKFRKKLINWYIWNIILHGAENWTLRKVDQKYLGSS
jgi:hypothetical protein